MGVCWGRMGIMGMLGGQLINLVNNKTMKKRNKMIWAKGTTIEEAYDFGVADGVRELLRVLVRDGDIDDNTIAWLLEKEYIDEIKKITN